MTSYRWKWTATIDRETLTVLQDMAHALGYVVTSPGGLNGRPSPADMLDALALAYRADPAAVIRAMQSIGVVDVTPPKGAE